MLDFVVQDFDTGDFVTHLFFLSNTNVSNMIDSNNNTSSKIP